MADSPVDDWDQDLDEELESSQEDIALVQEACEARTPSDSEDDSPHPLRFWWKEILEKAVPCQTVGWSYHS